MPNTNRFLSADTIIPNPADPQSYNMYSYARNNPINRTDPSGHIYVGCDVDCTPVESPSAGTPPTPLIIFEVEPGVNEEWTAAEKAAIRKGALAYAAALVAPVNQALASSKWASIDPNMVTPLTEEEAFLLVFGGSITFNKTGTDCPDPTGCFGQSVGNNTIDVYGDIYTGGVSSIPGRNFGAKWAIHEIGHVFEGKVNSIAGNSYARNQLASDPNFDTLLSRGGDNNVTQYGFAGTRYGWQQSRSNGTGEILADMQIGWVYGQWEQNPNGTYANAAIARMSFMQSHMQQWINLIVSQH